MPLLPIILAVVAAVAAIWLAVTGVRLLSDVNGPGCHGDHPFCTTPSQQSARQTLAMFCAVGVVAYLVSALPAARARRLGWPHVILGLVIALAALALVADPVGHLSSEAGSDQWFAGGWPL